MLALHALKTWSIYDCLLLSLSVASSAILRVFGGGGFMYLLPDGRDELTEWETPLCFFILSFGMVALYSGRLLWWFVRRAERWMVGGS